jgi:hypothetical protein
MGRIPESNESSDPEAGTSSSHPPSAADSLGAVGRALAGAPTRDPPDLEIAKELVAARLFGKEQPVVLLKRFLILGRIGAGGMGVCSTRRAI